jgi:hypothetical protein
MESRGQCPEKVWDSGQGPSYFLLTASRPALGPTQPYFPVGTARFFPGVKAPWSWSWPPISELWRRGSISHYLLSIHDVAWLINYDFYLYATWFESFSVENWFIYMHESCWRIECDQPLCLFYPSPQTFLIAVLVIDGVTSDCELGMYVKRSSK